MKEFVLERRIFLNREWDLLLRGKILKDGDVKVRIDLYSKPYGTIAKKKGITLRNQEIAKLVKELRDLYMRLSAVRDQSENREN